ncbi:hypothetical protein [Actinomadura sp. 21ATH]|uniref:hypothetical protein n=1 Tax=Actinomadura sp. 21ATH TaxID=1735444 RepID=UPI0035BEE4F0
MIWLSWRRFRLQALVGAVALAVIAGYLLYVGLEIRDAYDAYRSRCADPGECARACWRCWDGGGRYRRPWRRSASRR